MRRSSVRTAPPSGRASSGERPWSACDRSAPAGGTTDFVCSTRLPLLSQPGTLVSDTCVSAASAGGIERLGRALGLVPDRRHVFSRPSASFAAASPRQEVKVTVFEARKGRDSVLWHAVLTMGEMEQGVLGRPTGFFVPGRAARRVGEATLLQKSHFHEPEYYGLHAALVGLV